MYELFYKRRPIFVCPVREHITGRLQLKHVKHVKHARKKKNAASPVASTLDRGVSGFNPGRWQPWAQWNFWANLNLSPLWQWTTSGCKSLQSPCCCLFDAALARRWLGVHAWLEFVPQSCNTGGMERWICEFLLVCDRFSLLTQSLCSRLVEMNCCNSSISNFIKPWYNRHGWLGVKNQLYIYLSI